MSPFFERLRAALAPDYELLQELGSGGMGMVYLAREVALDRPVAVKALRPELVTAEGVTRFVREAQLLSKLRHPNIVVVHKVDKRDGLHFYVMEQLDGDTLQRRLETQGRLTHDEARKLGRDLLEALDVVHRLGVIHRDVKPSNLFVIGRRAVLTDFGIAKQATGNGLTDPWFTPGTAAYMAPELFRPVGGAGLLRRVEANERTDTYAAAMVIYEAFTDRRWEKGSPQAGEWAGVPRGVARVLRRALELDPEDRWPDAASFRRALWRTRVWPYRRNVIGVALVCAVIGAVLRPLPPSTTLHLSLQVAGAAPGLPTWLGDSISCGLARRLSAYPQLSAHCASGLARWWPRGRRGLDVRPEIENDAGRARVRLASSVEGIDGLEVRGAPDRWPVLADSLSDLVSAVLFGTAKLLDPAMSPLVLPKNPDGRLAFLRAERAFAQGRWGESRSAYAAAAALDPTCWICYWRHAEVGRWFDLADDPVDTARYHAHVADFPDYYQTLIRSERLPQRVRLDSLAALSRRWKDFLFGQFRLGDELLHRGPLVGHPRREAVALLENVVKVQPQFAPGLQHLAQVRIADGDSAEAAVALARAERLSSPGDPSFATLALLEVAAAWRFLPREAALRRTDELVAQAKQAGILDIDAGARFLAGYGSPEGELALAERLLSEPGFARSAGIARVLALVGLGRPDTALAFAGILAKQFPDLALFATELAAATILFDRDSVRYPTAWPAVRAALARDTTDRRAIWMLGMVEAGGTRSAMHHEDAASQPLVELLQATTLAQRGYVALALETSDALTVIPARRITDPFFRAALHLLRAQWYERAGRPAHARSELVWAENTDVVGYPKRDPQPAEVDWAFAPLAAWRLGVLLEQAGGTRDDFCRAYRTVASRWAGGEPRFRTRAETAARRLASLGCGRGPR